MKGIKITKISEDHRSVFNSGSTVDDGINEYTIVNYTIVKPKGGSEEFIVMNKDLPNDIKNYISVDLLQNVHENTSKTIESPF